MPEEDKFLRFDKPSSPGQGFVRAFFPHIVRNSEARSAAQLIGRQLDENPEQFGLIKGPRLSLARALLKAGEQGGGIDFIQEGIKELSGAVESTSQRQAIQQAMAGVPMEGRPGLQALAKLAEMFPKQAIPGIGNQLAPFTIGNKRYTGLGNMIVGNKSYSNLQTDDLGRVFGLNEDTQTIERVPQKAFPTNYKTIQGVDENGVPTTQLVDVSKYKTGIISVSKGAKPLPTVAQDNLSQAFDAFKALGQMQSGLSETGIVEGRISQAQAALGFNKKAIEFQTARANMKLAAQALIKGIPSNFDVQTVIDTLPEIGQPESVNKSRLKFSNDLLKSLVSRTIAYYKGTGYKIPQNIIEEAKKHGIAPESVKPWDGIGDPLTNKIPSLPPGFVLDANSN